MARAIKTMMFKEYEGRFADVDGGVILNYQGLTSQQSMGFRDLLVERGLKILVVKNTLFRRVLARKGIEANGLLVGPTAIVYGAGEGAAVRAAKAVEEWRQKTRLGNVRGAIFEGKVLAAKDVAVLARMPTRSELLSMLLSAVIAPATNVATLASNTLAVVPNLVANHIKKMEAGGASPAGG